MYRSYDVNLPELGHFSLLLRSNFEEIPEEAGRDNVHIHDAIEFYVLERGDISFFVGDKLYELTPGDVILAKPNEIHNCVRNSRCIHNHYCLWFSPACEVLLSDFLKHPAGEGNLIRLPDEEKRQLLTLCERVFTQAGEGKNISAYSSAVAILELCRGGLNVFPEEQSMPEELMRVLQLIEERMESIASVKDLCEALFMSQSTMLRLFRRHLGVSPYEYLDARRLVMARNYLSEGKSVTDAAALTGFTSTSVFIRLFRRRFGITPLKYRQMTYKN